MGGREGGMLERGVAGRRCDKDTLWVGGWVGGRRCPGEAGAKEAWIDRGVGGESEGRGGREGGRDEAAASCVRGGACARLQRLLAECEL